jgi:hypothetical protein
MNQEDKYISSQESRQAGEEVSRFHPNANPAMNTMTVASSPEVTPPAANSE